MKNFFIKLISGIILFFFIGLSISDLIDDYTYSVGQFPMILFTSYDYFNGNERLYTERVC